MKTFGKKILDFNVSLHAGFKLPRNVEVLNPFKNPEVLKVCKTFYNKYYNDQHKRVFIFGINPGRFGAGITGIPFTDPIRLEKECGIKNDFRKLPELSSLFIYEMIHAYGGMKKFYYDFFITAVCPLGFVLKGKNMNYYDDKNFYPELKHFIIDSIKKQIGFGAEGKFCICLGAGKNFDYLKKLNEENNFFKEVSPLPHPRWIMQYRRKFVKKFVTKYVETFMDVMK